jgi:hypothetical protein
MATPLKVIYVSADIGGSGIELKQPKGGLVMVWPADLNLSAALWSDLRDWQRWFNGVFDRHRAEERYTVLGDAFDEAGKQLAERVAQELGAEYQVVYEPQGGWRLASPDPPVPISIPNPNRE